MNKYIKKIIIYKLRLVCRAILWRHKPIVVAITGSVGKTTTKDIVAHGLANCTTVRKSQKNHNTDFGVPLSIIGVDNPWSSTLGWFKVILEGVQIIFKKDYPKVLVLEVGTRFPGDIARLAKWLKPHVAIITHIPEIPVHIEFFGTREAVVDEKSALAKYSRKDATVILNKDSKFVFEIAQNTNRKVFSIGFTSDADITANSVERIVTDDGVFGMKFNAIVKGNSMPVFAPGFIAKHQVYGALFALAAGESLGYDTEQIAYSMQSLTFTPGRLNPLLGINNTLILDDSYNASPTAMEAALETLISIDTPGRHVALLGDMLDLGKMTKEAHEEIASFLLANKIDYVYLLGPRMKYAYDLLLENKYPIKKLEYYENPQDVITFILGNAKDGDVILVKGSQGMRMEKIVKELIFDKNNAHKLLARQDDEWQKR